MVVGGALILSERCECFRRLNTSDGSLLEAPNSSRTLRTNDPSTALHSQYCCALRVSQQFTQILFYLMRYFTPCHLIGLPNIIHFKCANTHTHTGTHTHISPSQFLFLSLCFLSFASPTPSFFISLLFPIEPVWLCICILFVINLYFCITF